MGNYYLAVDIGASSGRHILGHMEGGELLLEEVYRFENGMTTENGVKCWDVEYLFGQILAGMKECAKRGKVPYSMGIDTWAVDFVLLDKDGSRLGNAVAYRDLRTKGMDTEVYNIIKEDELYLRTGIQKQKFNTIYQLMAVKKQNEKMLHKADKMLLIPDYFHYLLTGQAVTEYTNATTTQLVSPNTKNWDYTLIHMLAFPEQLFQKIKMPGYELGGLKDEIQKEVGFNCKVILPATHDTASAVMAVPSRSKNTLYISSGTWSLIGTELPAANCSLLSKSLNMTNEGGYNYCFRYLKNIMGLWMIQSVKKEIANDINFGDICKMASTQNIDSFIDCNDNRFLAPESMTQEIQNACIESGQQKPEGIAEVAAVIYNSLAECYAKAVTEIEEVCGRHFDQINIVGGGSKAEYLNQLTAKATGRKVLAGPTEATALGNLAAQLISAKELLDLEDARTCIYSSFTIKEYEP